MVKHEKFVFIAFAFTVSDKICYEWYQGKWTGLQS